MNFPEGPSNNSEDSKYEQESYDQNKFALHLENLKQNELKSFDKQIARAEAEGDYDYVAKLKNWKERQENSTESEWKLLAFNNMHYIITWPFLDYKESDFLGIAKEHYKFHVGINTPEEWVEKFKHDLNEVLDTEGLREEYENYVQAMVERKNVNNDNLEEFLNKYNLLQEWESRKENKFTSFQEELRWISLLHWVPLLEKIFIGMRDKGWDRDEIAN